MRTAKLIMMIFCLSGSAAFAERVVQETDPSAFDQMSANDLTPEILIFTQNPVEDFTSWQASKPVDGQLLVLYPGYSIPKVVYDKDGARLEMTEDLMIYETKNKTVLNQSPDQVQARLPRMITLAQIQKLDPTIKHRQIRREELIQNVVGKEDVTNFDWCGAGNIVRPKKEVDLSHLKTHNYCQNAANSTCVESCYIFGDIWRTGMTIAIGASEAKTSVGNGVKRIGNAIGVTNAGPTETDRKDYGVGIQSEVRYFTSEADYQTQSGNKTALASLTKINTPVRGVIEQNMFYFNQVFQYAKVLVVLQEHPNDSSKTIMNSYVAMGIKERSWKKYDVLPEILAGTSLFNLGEGLTQGVPLFTQAMAAQTAKMLEQ